MIPSRAGLIGIILVVFVSVATWTSYSLIQYGRNIQATETEVIRNEEQRQTRQRVDQAVRSNSRPSSPDDNRLWLQQRQDRLR
jgi:hypothetical protein